MEKAEGNGNRPQGYLDLPRFILLYILILSLRKHLFVLSSLALALVPVSLAFFLFFVYCGPKGPRVLDPHWFGKSSSSLSLMRTAFSIHMWPA